MPLRPITTWAEWRRFLDQGMLSSEVLAFLTQHAKGCKLLPFALQEIDGIRVERSWSGAHITLGDEARFVHWCTEKLTEEAAGALRAAFAERALERYKG